MKRHLVTHGKLSSTLHKADWARETLAIVAARGWPYLAFIQYCKRRNYLLIVSEQMLSRQAQQLLFIPIVNFSLLQTDLIIIWYLDRPTGWDAITKMAKSQNPSLVSFNFRITLLSIIMLCLSCLALAAGSWINVRLYLHCSLQ